MNKWTLSYAACKMNAKYFHRLQFIPWNHTHPLPDSMSWYVTIYLSAYLGILWSDNKDKIIWAWIYTWWRHDMEKLSTLLALWDGNPTVTDRWILLMKSQQCGSVLSFIVINWISFWHSQVVGDLRSMTLMCRHYNIIFEFITDSVLIYTHVYEYIIP